MKGFIKSIRCNYSLFGVFEDDGETGYLYNYSPNERKIHMNLVIYNRENGKLEPNEENVKLSYDKVSNNCGVYIWGKLRGLINFSEDNPEKDRLRFSSPEDPGISTSQLPELYDNKLEIIDDSEINKAIFIVDRQNYWKDLAHRLKKE